MASKGPTYLREHNDGRKRRLVPVLWNPKSPAQLLNECMQNAEHLGVLRASVEWKK